MPTVRPLAAFVVPLALVACGGSSDAERADDAIARANAKEAQARAAGVVSPCASAAQCGSLVFLNPNPSVCGTLTFKTYSTVSASAAAASAAASEQVVLALQARALAADSTVACPAVVETPPALACSANACGP